MNINKEKKRMRAAIEDAYQLARCWFATQWLVTRLNSQSRRTRELFTPVDPVQAAFNERFHPRRATAATSLFTLVSKLVQAERRIPTEVATPCRDSAKAAALLAGYGGAKIR